MSYMLIYHSQLDIWVIVNEDDELRFIITYQDFLEWRVELALQAMLQNWELPKA